MEISPVKKTIVMITFGYKGKFNGLLRALTAIAIGVVMVMSKANALNIAVRVIAVFLVASGVVSALVGIKNKQNGTLPLMGFNAIVDVLLGLMLFLFPGFFAGLLIYLIAFALLGFGVFQLISLVSANRVMKVGVMAFVLPVIVMFLGMFLLVNPSFIGEAIGIVAGAALIVYGVSELLSSWKMKKAIDEYEIKYPEKDDTPRETPEQEVRDVDYEKVDEQ